jgi:DNA-binding MarR family transcriptional regulator
MDKTVKSSNNGIICTCLKLRRASQAISKVYDEYLEASGIKISQFSLLKAIDRKQPVNVSDLAVYIKLDRTTLVRNLKPLEQKGLIADIAKKGARNRQLILSRQGKEVLTAATSLWQEAQDGVEQALGEEDLAQLSFLLSRIEKLDRQ